MPTIFAKLNERFKAAIQEAFGLDVDPQLSVSQNPQFGDYQSNAAMGLAKKLGQKPRETAEKIKSHLKLEAIAQEVSIAGPGFINVKLSHAWLAQELRNLLDDGRLGIEKVSQPQTVVVDYSGPNIAKEMHVGHLRSTIIGDAISRVLEFQGHAIIRQNHIGDWGTQFGKVLFALWYWVMWSTEHDFPAGPQNQRRNWVSAQAGKNQDRMRTIVGEVALNTQKFVKADPDGDSFEQKLEQNWLPFPELAMMYQFISEVTDSPDADHHPIEHPRHGRHTLAKIPQLTTTFLQNPGDHRNAPEELAWKKATAITLAASDELYTRLRVKLTREDVRGESDYKDDLKDIVAELTRLGLASKSKGARVVFIDGPDKPPMIVQKSDGAFLYSTTDLAAIRYRVIKLHAQRIIYVHDSRQTHHFAQLFAVAKKAHWADDVLLEFAPFGTMLGEDGKPFKTRTGGTVKLRELLDEAERRAEQVVNQKNIDLPEAQKQAIAHAIGIGAVKYSDLAKDRIADYVFSFDKMLSLDGNTAPYLQYAHARIRSIFRKADSTSSRQAGDFKTEQINLESPFELSLAKHIVRLGETIESVARELKPHLLCTYLYDLATKFSGFYENCPVIQREEPTRTSRLALCKLTAATMALGLDLLGIEHPDQM